MTANAPVHSIRLIDPRDDARLRTEIIPRSRRWRAPGLGRRLIGRALLRRLTGLDEIRNGNGGGHPDPGHDRQYHRLNALRSVTETFPSFRAIGADAVVAEVRSAVEGF